MKILAVDPGTKTGWALGDTEDNSRLYSGMQDFKLKRGESMGMRFLYFDRWIYKMIAEFKPEVVAYEMPFVRGVAVLVLNGLVGILLKACSEAKIDYFSVNPSTLKKHASGRGKKVSKAEMIALARTKFHRQPVDDNEADALHLWDYAREQVERRSGDDS